MDIDINTAKLLADPSKRRAWIMFQLRLKGDSLAGIAKRVGVSRQTVRKALYGSYPRMEKAIAGALGMKHQILFPDRYECDGKSRTRMGRPRKVAVNCTKFPEQRNINSEDVAVNI